MSIKSRMSLIMGQVIPDQWVLSALEIEKLNFSSLFRIIFILNLYCLVLRWAIKDHHGPLVFLLLTPKFFLNFVCWPFPKQAIVFTCLQYKSFENTLGKGKIARKEQFLLFPQCFLPVRRTFFHFHYTKNCCLQTLLVWKSLKFGKGLNQHL